MANLLDQASIVLTPTAYDDGKVLCAKPSEAPYGDFDFSRNSAATRVNAQGLVENVQILSSNLVQNGDFSEEGAEEVSNGSFSQEGAEQITNGDFATDTDWGKEVGWTISNGSLVANSVTTGLAFQSNIVEANKSYKATYSVVVTSGSIGLYFDGGTGYQGIVTTTQTITVFFKATTASPLYFRSNTSNFTGSIESVSCVEVGQDWTLETGWSIGEDKAVANVIGTQAIYQSGITLNKWYKATYTISDYVSGDIRVRVGTSSTPTVRSSNGTFTEYLYATGVDQIRISPFTGGFIGSITNISVKEVGMDWGIINATITDVGNLNGTGVTSMLYQDVLTNGSTYTATFTISNYNSIGNSDIINAGGAPIYVINSNGTFTITFTHTNASGNIYWRARNSAIFSIDDVTIIEISTDTNLPRINYENFSYQDALGSEEVVNGDFSSDNNWIKGTGWNISGGSANGSNTTSDLYQENVVESGKYYKVTYTISNYVSGTVRVELPSNAFAGTERSANGTYTEILLSGGTIVLFDARTSFTGSIDNVSVKEYLGQEVVPNSGCGSWLFEPQSTNLITQSELFSDASWNANSDVIIDKGYLAPDGTNNATKVTVDGANPKVALFTSTFPIVTKSIYARTVSGTGTVYLGEGNINGVLSNVTEQWQRFEITNNKTAYYAVDFRGASTLTEVIIWGAQLEQQSYATSYIPTNGEANGVTRNQDVCNNGGSLATINSTEGVLYAEIAALANDGTFRSIALSDGTLNNRIIIFYSDVLSEFRALIAYNGIFQTVINTNINVTDTNKIALKYRLNDVALWINGVKISVDNSATMPLGLNRLSFDRGDGANNFFGKTKAVAVFPYLTDQELTELTTI